MGIIGKCIHTIKKLFGREELPIGTVVIYVRDNSTNKYLQFIGYKGTIIRKSTSYIGYPYVIDWEGEAAKMNSVHFARNEIKPYKMEADEHGNYW